MEGYDHSIKDRLQEKVIYVDVKSKNVLYVIVIFVD
jgi:hypothetical protein